MIFEAKVAVRYLVSSRLQTGLLGAGVAVGVVVFTFIAALMNGLGAKLTADITANAAHVTLEPETRVPRTFMDGAGMRTLFAVQPGQEVEPVIRTYRPLLAIASRVPGVRLAVPEVFGSASLGRGEKELAVTVTGVDPAEASAIVPLDDSMVRGRLDLGVGNVVVGARLADELAIRVGDRVVLRASRLRAGANAARTELDVTVRGIFSLGIQAVDERAVYLDLDAARKLFDLTAGVSIIEIKVDDVWQARAVSDRLGRATRLKSRHWLERNTRLESGLRAQASSGAMIKGFSLLTIAIGVASALYLAVARRRGDIGIMRSFGIGRGAIVRIFVLQGLFVGLAGALGGAALGFGFAHVLRAASMTAFGTPSIPIDPMLGEYLRAILLATFASAIAAVLPARSAARIDPLEAIQS